MKRRPRKAAKAKKPQPRWGGLQRPMPANAPPPAPERAGAPKLLTKAEILSLTRASYPTVWKWMQTEAFPRSRVVGGKSLWIGSEVQKWLDDLPIRRLKGDEGAAV